ncbi:2-acylglycerol O-acyltransferase 1-like isoform X2 [Coccinella septempunctata]|uniref:2-acylglycerol O-acyltransferase 1-like isoform X2 n=1 Tax=Coccinella septempunctata TaxID=41139 RepID=UPI001D069239|nr:2-acylglycerol O-acyltransferase 1-like isoform X2 [Coccinella septempunctata]
MKLLNIKFAPLNVPLQRRLQTLAMTALIVSHVFGCFISYGLVYYFIFHTKLWWLCSLYLMWCFFIDTDPRKGSNRRSKWIRRWTWWKYVKNYFPVELIKGFEGDLDASRNYLFCYFPHGLLSHGATMAFGSEHAGVDKCFPNHAIYGHTLSFTFSLPFIRELVFGIGGLPSSRECIDYIVGKSGGGNISCLVVGGAEESFYCEAGVHKIVLKKRKGFIKIALRNGCPLVPVYGFGENEIFGQYKFKGGTFMWKFQRFFKRVTGCAFIIVKGRGVFQYSFGILPHRRPITVVVGEPIDVEKTENPTQEQIDNLHQLFEKKLVELFESQKKHYLKEYENAHLEII